MYWMSRLIISLSHVPVIIRNATAQTSVHAYGLLIVLILFISSSRELPRLFNAGGVEILFAFAVPGLIY
ncbi:hypothetical protein C8J55DRAFT_527517 [Lentinula edodes]|uniref:Uncharacterized protein n=1 Tax=Lentinula lateritia TaxID=40482 RepID=A0A9W8ZU25_9AGAR|nr:hypothetical protein C8J55DRAFT_527517 [Lentinula edodes]